MGARGAPNEREEGGSDVDDGEEGERAGVTTGGAGASSTVCAFCGEGKDQRPETLHKCMHICEEYGPCGCWYHDLCLGKWAGDGDSKSCHMHAPCSQHGHVGCVASGCMPHVWWGEE